MYSFPARERRGKRPVRSVAVHWERWVRVEMAVVSDEGESNSEANSSSEVGSGEGMGERGGLRAGNGSNKRGRRGLARGTKALTDEVKMALGSGDG